MAVKNFELQLAFTSRFKRTRLFIKGGRAFFGLWRPLNVKIDGDEEQIIITADQQGQLDRFAFAVYGDRSLWPIIAHVNKIDFPHFQVVTGLKIIIPKAANVNAALLATISRQVAQAVS